MNRFGLGKFILVSMGMILFLTLSLKLFGYIYTAVFGLPLPAIILNLLLALCLLTCSIKFLYRLIYGGREEVERPTGYVGIVQILDLADFFCAFFILSLLWYRSEMWFGFIWIGLYLIADTLLKTLAENRALGVRLIRAQLWYPERTPEAHVMTAKELLISDIERGYVL